MKTPELKPCPFCGYPEPKYRPNKNDDGSHEPEIICQGDHCGICVSFAYYGHGLSPEFVFEDVAKEWNKRAPAS